MDILPVLLSVAIAFMMTLLGGAFGIRFRKRIILLMAFTAGVLIALALFELLPEILSLANTEILLDTSILLILSGFVFLLGINRFVFKPQKQQGTGKRTLRSSTGLLAASEFCTHALLEGFAIGLSFQFSFALGILAAIAVVSHDFCDGLVTVTLMLSSGNSVKKSFSLLVVDAAAPIVGASATLLFALPANYLIFSLSFLTGGFFYLGTMHLFHQSYRESPKLTTLAAFACGIFLVFALARILSSLA